MQYTQLQRNEYEPFITIGEYLYNTDPFMFEQLCLRFIYKDVYTVWKEIQQVALPYMKRIMEHIMVFEQKTKVCLTSAIEHLMKEPPKPGRGGLLPGETEEDLY